MQGKPESSLFFSCFLLKLFKDFSEYFSKGTVPNAELSSVKIIIIVAVSSRRKEVFRMENRQSTDDIELQKLGHFYSLIDPGH